MDRITVINQHLSVIKLPCLGVDNLLAAYVLTGEKNAVFETGVTNTAPLLLEGLSKLGIKPDDVHFLIVSHIHMDHAGGLGYLSRYLPNAKVLVHERGAKHLIDPSRLIASTKKVFGERDVVTDNYGEMLPVPADRVVALHDQDVIELGNGRELKIIFTPGHAPHHLCIFDNQSKGIFTGEALGTYIADVNTLSPSPLMPDFNLEMTIDSILRLTQFEAKALYFSHCSSTTDVQNTIYRSIGQLLAWSNVVRNFPPTEAGDKLTEYVMKAEWDQWSTVNLGKEKGLDQLLEWLSWRIKAVLEPALRNDLIRRDNIK